MIQKWVPAKLALLLAMTFCCSMLADQISREYIRINGRLVAIENIANGDFAVSLSSGTATVARGGSTTVTVTVTPSGGFTGPVALSIPSGLPSGVTYTFSPASLTLGAVAATTTLTLNADVSAATGTVTLSVQGAAGSVVRSSSLNLTTSLAPDFSFSSLTSLSIEASGDGTRALTVTGSNGFAESVNLTASGLPSGVTAVFSPATVSGGSGTSTITFAATAGASLGTSTVTITGTSSGSSLTRTATLSLTVVAQSTFTLAASTGATITTGAAADSTITIAKAGSFNSVVTLSATNLPAGVSVTFTPASVTGAGTSTMRLTVGSSAAPGSYTITIKASSSSPSIERSVSFALVISAPQQGINSASITPSNATEMTMAAVATDPSGADHIMSVEFSFSTSLNSNTFLVGNACRYRVNRTTVGGSSFSVTIAHRDGNGSIIDTKPVGQAITLTNGACSINLAQTTVTQSGANLNISVRVMNVAMSGTHYLRGMTTTDGSSSLPQAYSYLSATWNVPTAPSATFSNNQGVTPPVVYSSYTTTVTMAVANQGSSGFTLKLAEAGDGTLQLSGTNPLSGLYTAANAGEDRDVILRGIICSSTCTANESNRTHEYLYTIRVRSSASSPPSLNFVNPFTGTDKNPSPLNSTVTANGTATTFLSFGINNQPYPAAKCTYYPVSVCSPITSLQVVINRSFSNNFNQDAENGCRLTIWVAAGSSPVGYSFSLAGDIPPSSVGANWYSGSSASASMENSQCKINIGTTYGTYAATPYGNDPVLGMGLQYVFKAPFAGTRYVFMKGDRNTGDSSAWQYRGSLTLQ